MIHIFDNPERDSWPQLLQRPLPETKGLVSKVESIIQAVASGGDAALYDYTERFDRISLDHLEVEAGDIDKAGSEISDALKKAITQAATNIRNFHVRQALSEEACETMPGVNCWRESRPIEKVGLYVPGGSAPLFSTVLMLAIPAEIAGCRQVIICTPPQSNGKVNPAVLFAASITGVHKVYMVGGAQAIAAMALGTETIPKVEKIFGPGNHFVTEAKMAAQRLGVAIDMPAGPSEVLILADDTADADFVAADMISQAEHGADSQVVLVTNHLPLVDQTKAALDVQLKTLPRADIAEAAINNSMIIYFKDVEECMHFSNAYAPEHLIICLKDARSWANRVKNAGSVFLGNYSPESIGDYASGTNHTLPTAGWARSYSGVSLDSFVKKITFQELTKAGLAELGPLVEIMAEAESLIGHKRAVSVRLNKLQ